MSARQRISLSKPAGSSIRVGYSILPRNRHAPHAKPGINHGGRIALPSRLAGSDREVLRVGAAANIPFQTGGIVDTRRVQHLAAEPIERLGFDDALLSLGSLDQQVQIVDTDPSMA